MPSTAPAPKSLHAYSVQDLAGQPVNLADYAGKTLLVVNTASHCAFTPQYKTLNQLQEMYADKGFTVLAFPSDSFNQEYKDEGKIQAACDVKFKPQFPVLQKVKVRGAEQHPVFKFLSDKALNGRINKAPRWNFYKYLIDGQGQVVDVFTSIASPTSKKITRKIEQLIAKNA